MAPRGKKTTMAKLAREHRLRERRLDKAARKDARKHAASIDAAHPEGIQAAHPEGIPVTEDE
jgi:hypothetical protein